MPSASSMSSSSGLEMDLTSTARNISAGQFVQNNTVQIRTGLQNTSVTQDSLLTAAEAMAVNQVLATGQQSLKLNRDGAAVGGSFTLGNSLASALAGLVIPRGVTALNLASELNLGGNLVNRGTLYSALPVSSGNQSTISATNIYNNRSALITTMVPQEVLAQLTSAESFAENLSLALNASGEIVNAGTITSAGNLNLTATNIVNATSSTSTASALMQAAQNLNLTANNIANSGTLASLAGNLNLSSHMSHDLAVNNSGGTMEALNGVMNVSSNGSAAEKLDVSFMGGNLRANQLNFRSLEGSVEVNVNDLVGRMNVDAGLAHVTAASENLTLGNMNLTGDPTFYNTNGSVTIDGSLVFSGEALAIVAKTNILSSTAGMIDTSSATTSGGTIMLVAGADFTVSPSNTSSATTSGQNAGAGDSTNTIKIKGGTTAGGFIDLTGGTGAGGGTDPITLTSASSSATVGDQNGGDIMIVAYGGTGANAGTINLPTAPLAVQSSGAGTGVNGNITMIAGSTTQNAYGINIGGLDATGGSGGGGVVSLNTAKPMITGGGGKVSILNGMLELGSGNFTPGKSTPTSVILNGDIDANQINITAGANISWFNTGTSVGTIPDFFGPFTIAFNPSGTEAWVTNFGSNDFTPTGDKVSIIDTLTNTVIDTITVGTMPSGVTFNPSGTLAYVTNYNDPNSVPGPGTVDIIDTESLAIVGSIIVGNGAADIQINPQGTIAYVANYISNTVSVIDLATNTVVKTINVGVNPTAITFDPSGKFAYVPNANSNTVSVIKVSNHTVVRTISGFDEPFIAAMNPAGTRLYVTNSGDGPGKNTVAVIDTATNKIITTITGFLGSSGADVNPNGTLAYITNYGFPFVPVAGTTISAVNTQTNTIVDTLPGDTFVTAVKFSPQGTLAYAANYNDGTEGNGTLTVISLTPPVMRAPSITLKAGTTGSGFIHAFTETANLTANAKGNVSVYNTGPVTLSANNNVSNGAVGTFKLITVPDLAENGAITINDRVTVTGGTIQLQSSEDLLGTGGISQTANGFLSSTYLNLADSECDCGPGTGLGNIGSLGNEITTDAQFLVANTLGDVYIKDNSAVTISAPSTGSVFSLSSVHGRGSINIANPILAFTSLNLSTSAANGLTIFQSADAQVVTTHLIIALAGTSSADLSTSTKNDVIELSSTSTGASSITLYNGGHDIQLNTFGANQNITVLEAAMVTVGPANITVGSLTVGGTSMDLGAILVGSSTTRSITLAMDGSGFIGQSFGGLLTAAQVNLGVKDGGTIEQFGPAPLSINAARVSVFIGGSGGIASITNSASGPITLGDSMVVNGTFTFVSTDAAGSITTRETVTAKTLTIATTAGDAGITLGGPTGEMGGATMLTASGAGGITSLRDGKVIGLSVELASTTGNIYASTIAPQKLTANTGGTGKVTLTNDGSLTLQNSTAGGDFSITALGALEVFATVTAGGNVTLTAENIAIDQNKVITANNGNVLVFANDQEGGSIRLEKGSSLIAKGSSTSLGNVTVTVGTARPARRNTVTPANITEVKTAGGEIYYGANSIASFNGNEPPDLAGNSTLTATARTINLSTGRLPATAIQLDGKNIITAQPIGYLQENQSEDFIVDTGDAEPDPDGLESVQASL